MSNKELCILEIKNRGWEEMKHSNIPEERMGFIRDNFFLVFDTTIEGEYLLDIIIRDPSKPAYSMRSPEIYRFYCHYNGEKTLDALDVILKLKEFV